MGVQKNVIKSLVIDASNDVLTKDLTTEDLAVGQIGMFLPNGISFDKDVSPLPRKFYYGVKRPDGYITKSAGQMIYPDGIRQVTIRSYSPQQTQMFSFKLDCVVHCETEYGIGFNFNGKDFRTLFGDLGVNAQFMVQTDCCCDTDCSSCNLATYTEVLYKIKDKMNADSEGILTAKLYQDDGTTELTTREDADTWQEANEGVSPVLTVEVNSFQAAASCGYVLSYQSINSFMVRPYFIDKLNNCTASFEETRALSFEVNGGRAVQFAEQANVAYEGNGYENAYRKSHGYLKPSVTTAKPDGKYVSYHIHGKVRSIGLEQYIDRDYTSEVYFELGSPAIETFTEIMDVLTDGRFELLKDTATAIKDLDTVNQMPPDMDGIG